MKRHRSRSSDERRRKPPKTESTFDHLCSDCSAMEWSSLAEKLKNNQSVDDFNETVTKSHEELQLSSCGVCQLLFLLKRPDLDTASRNLQAKNLYKLFTGRTTLPHPLQPDTAILSAVSGTNKPQPTRRQLGHVIAVEPSPQAPSFVHPQRFDHENVNFGSIAKWIDYCVENHPDCEPGTRSSTHTLQVIDCKMSDDVNKDVPELVDLPNGGIYAALSYVWGAVKPKFPQVVRDSITVALQLNCKYLWVDRHCIDQDDSDAEKKKEKQRQIGMMNDIYSQAKFTIVDAAGKDCTYGLAGVTHPRKPELRYAHVPGAQLTYLGTPPAEKIRSSRWASRGWTFQEGNLSRRRIFFTDEQVMFQCNNMSCIESFEIPMNVLHRLDKPNQKKKPRLTDTEPLRLGSKEIGAHLMEFSNRNLTNDDDILKAFLGVLNDFRKKDICIHVRGDPIHVREEDGHLINAWYHVKPGARNVKCPSWSWTGWKGEIKMTSHNNPDYDVQLFNGDGDLTSLDEYRETCGTNSSQDMGPLIQLTGMMTKLSFELIKWDSDTGIPKEKAMQDGAWAMLPLTDDMTCYSFLYLDEALTGVCQFELPVMLLESGIESREHNVVMLVLREKGGCYERAGMVILWQKDNEAEGKVTRYRDERGRWIKPVLIPKVQDCIWYKALKHESILLQ